jgi:hypothetical protein
MISRSGGLDGSLAALVRAATIAAHPTDGRAAVQVDFDRVRSGAGRVASGEV